MRIAVFLNQGESGGGGFQYELSVAKLLQERSCDKYEFLFFSSSPESIPKFLDYNIKVIHFKSGYLSKIHSKLLSNLVLYNRVFKILNIHHSKLDRLLTSYNIDLVYFLSPSGLSSDLTSLNFMTTVWDLCHRDHVEFPEVYRDRQFETREANYYETQLKRAVAVFSDSELGKKNILRRYGVDSDRVVVQPFLYSLSLQGTVEINIKEKYSLSTEYIFYPAQFWAHKNHIYILKSIKILKDKFNKEVHALFSGADHGNLEFIRGKSHKLGISHLVKFLGFVDSTEISSLYKQSIGLVMPTYFGPTNIPPLEAFNLQCPVFYSDLDGLREQVGDAGFLINLNDPESFAKSLLFSLANPDIVQKKIELGKSKLAELTPENFWLRLEPVLYAFSIKIECFKNVD